MDDVECRVQVPRIGFRIHTLRVHATDTWYSMWPLDITLDVTDFKELGVSVGEDLQLQHVYLWRRVQRRRALEIVLTLCCHVGWYLLHQADFLRVSYFVKWYQNVGEALLLIRYDPELLVLLNVR